MLVWVVLTPEAAGFGSLGSEERGMRRLREIDKRMATDGKASEQLAAEPKSTALTAVDRFR